MLYKTGTTKLNSTVAAARSRLRGPTISEQRAEQQREELRVVAVAEAARELRAEAKAAKGSAHRPSVPRPCKPCDTTSYIYKLSIHFTRTVIVGH